MASCLFFLLYIHTTSCVSRRTVSCHITPYARSTLLSPPSLFFPSSFPSSFSSLRELLLYRRMRRIEPLNFSSYTYARPAVPTIVVETYRIRHLFVFLPFNRPYFLLTYNIPITIFF